MKLHIPAGVIARLKSELRQAGRREMGGVLVGEHVRDDVFRLVDLSFQRSGGSETHFVRDPEKNRAFLAEFFQKTDNDYQRFNYIGEWHSHPLFHPTPSGTDVATMLELVRDPAVGVNFAILVIVSLRGRSTVMMSATAFQPGAQPSNVDVEFESDASEPQAPGMFAWLRNVVKFILR